MRRVGVVGIGNMGAGIAHNLREGKFEVVLYSKRCGDPLFEPERDETFGPLMEKGCRVAKTLREVGEFSQVVITSVPMPEDFLAVCTGDEGLIASMKEGSYIIDTSTIDVETTRRVHSIAGDKGIRTLDAPVSGGPAGARNGTMTIMAGGDKEDFDACLPIFECIGGNINYMGRIGTGQMVKLCNQAISASQSAVMGEVFVTGIKAGLGLEDMANVIRASSGNCWMLENFFPETVFKNKFDPPRFALRMMLKDIDLYMRTARALGVPSIVSGTVMQMFTAAMAMGNGELDVTSVVQVAEKLGEQKILSDGENNG